MTTERIKKWLPRITVTGSLIVFMSAAFQAFGIYNVHALSSVTEGGMLGLTLLFEQWFNISPSISGFIMNAACFYLGWRTMGKEFLAYSAIAAAGFSICYAICEQFPPVYPEIANHPLAAAIVGAIFIGVGAGFSVRVGGATAGDDALAMSLNRLTKIDIQWIYLVFDIIVLGLSLTYIPLKRIAYSLVTVVLSGQIVGLIQKINIRKREQ